jgi:hypothetical protein
MRAAGPTDRGSGPSGSRVAYRCPSGGLGRQHILARPVGPSTPTTSTSTIGMSKGDPVTYEELTPEHKQKFDEIKVLFEADLIRSFERTCHHGIRWKGFSPEGALDGVHLSLPSEERTKALRQEVNYMVAHSLHRHSESLVTPWGVTRGNCRFKPGQHCLMHLRLQNHTVHQRMSCTRWEETPRITSFQRAT